MEAFALRAEDAQELHRPLVGVAEPVREVGVELGDLARSEHEVLVVDISRNALERAAAAAAHIEGRVAWTRADLNITPPPADAFDLVSVQYFPLVLQPDHTALRGLLDAVAPGREISRRAQMRSTRNAGAGGLGP